ncbi:MAG: hypothetical protein NZO16_05655 [Deltaproteobacteria bacterium]|nr:hypothetical protein [Deltaproteobacteria bacterium]
MKTKFLPLLIFMCFADDMSTGIRHSQDAEILDYVAELEKTVDELLKKIYFLEEKTQVCSSNTADTHINPATEVKRLEEEIHTLNNRLSDCQNQLARFVSSDNVAKLSDKAKNDELVNKLRHCEHEGKMLREKLVECEKNISQTSFDEKSHTDDISDISKTKLDPEIANLKSLLKREIGRAKELGLDDERTQELLRALDQAKTYKELSEIKSKLQSFKRTHR